MPNSALYFIGLFRTSSAVRIFATSERIWHNYPSGLSDFCNAIFQGWRLPDAFLRTWVSDWRWILWLLPRNLHLFGARPAVSVSAILPDFVLLRAKGHPRRCRIPDRLHIRGDKSILTIGRWRLLFSIHIHWGRGYHPRSFVLVTNFRAKWQRITLERPGGKPLAGIFGSNPKRWQEQDVARKQVPKLQVNKGPALLRAEVPFLAAFAAAWMYLRNQKKC